MTFFELVSFSVLCDSNLLPSDERNAAQALSLGSMESYLRSMGATPSPMLDSPAPMGEMERFILSGGAR